MSKARSKSMRAARLALGALAISGCADVDVGDVEQQDAEETSETELGSSSQALSASQWKDLLCDIVNEVPSTSVGNFDIDEPVCKGSADPRLFYFGSGGPGDYASTIATATYCAIAEAGTSTADATIPTVVGRFGGKSQVIAHSRNNQKRHIETEHLGKVVAFGVEIPMQFAEATWDFPTEHQPRQRLPAVHDNPVTGASHRYTQTVPKQDGYYMRTDGWTLKEWSIGGDGWFMAGPVKVNVDVDLKSKEPLKHYGNGRFSPKPASWARYSDAVAAAEECRATCIETGPISCDFLCGGPTPEQVKGHELLCGDDGCTAAYFEDLSDGVLPYSGPFGGARGNFLYGDPLPNFWQTGYPGWKPLTALDEPKYGLLADPFGRSTAFNLTLTAGYKVGSVARIELKTTLDFETRAGMSLRSERIPDGDLGGASGERGRVHLDLDAETAINLNAELHLTIPLVFTTIDFRADYDIIDRTTDGHDSDSERASMIEWTIAEEGENDAPTAACTQFETPEAPRVHPPVKPAEGFLQDVATKSVEYMHPCNVRICVPSSPNSRTGKFTKYKWNDDKNELVVDVVTNTSCNVCDSSAALCNDKDEVITAMDTSNSCDDEPLCGGGEVCDSIDDCSQPLGGGGCIGGCCVQIR